jgi:hypothetical protein
LDHLAQGTISGAGLQATALPGDQAEAAIASLLKGEAEVNAHLEPAGIHDERLDQKIELVEAGATKSAELNE